MILEKFHDYGQHSRAKKERFFLLLYNQDVSAYGKTLFAGFLVFFYMIVEGPVNYTFPHFE